MHRGRDDNGAAIAVKIFDCGRRGIEEFVQELEAYVRLNSEQWGSSKCVCRAIVVRRNIDVLHRLFASVVGFGFSERWAYVCLPFFPINLADALCLPGINPLAIGDVSRVFCQVARGVQCTYREGDEGVSLIK